MRRFNLLICFVIITFMLFGCNVGHRNESLNLNNFKEFYYKDNLYKLPDNFYELYSDYSFYGNMHQIGYTIGVYNKVFETYALDIDVEENILFQKDGRYFWFKDGYEWPDTNQLNINRLLIEVKDDNESFYTEKTLEYSIENVLLEDLLIEYSVDSATESYLLDTENYRKYDLSLVYENGIKCKYFAEIMIYNDQVYVQKKYSLRDKKVYVFDEKYSTSIYDFILNNE